MFRRSVNSQELEETTLEKKRVTKRSSGKMGSAARWSNDLILCLIGEYVAPSCVWDTRATAGELSSTITNFFDRLTM